MRKARFQVVELPRAVASKPCGSARDVRTPPLRLPQFIGIEASPRQLARRLCRLRVAVVGAGAVGGHIARHIGRWGPSCLAIVDHDRFAIPNLATQPIDRADVGLPKASATAAAIKRLNPTITVLACDAGVETLPADALADFDVVLLASDNLSAEVEVNTRCMRFGVPLIAVAVYGDALVAQVTVLGNRNENSPCLTCSYSPAEWDHLTAETRFSCNGAGGRHRARTMPTMSAPGLCALAANLGVVALVRLVLGAGDPIADYRLQYCGFTHETVTMPLTCNSNCGSEHVPRCQVTLPEPLAALSLHQIAQMAAKVHRRSGSHVGNPTRTQSEYSSGPSTVSSAYAPTTSDVSFELHDMLFVSEPPCGCRDSSRVGRFQARSSSIRRCRACGQRPRLDRFNALSRVPLNLVGPLLARPLRSLGAGSARCVSVLTREGVVTFRSMQTTLRKATP